MIVDKRQSAIGALIGGVVGIILMFFTTLLTGGGHGIYWPIFVSFPYTSVLWVLPLPETICFCWAPLALIQYPVYGAVLAGRSGEQFNDVLLSLLGLHFMAAILTLAIAAITGNFLP